ncbi:MAG: methyltransferase domain-containing protein [Proteobacteria bacterium]|nr:methyltransferase domain-containing protein [Pseudomonadota bacterium]
MHTDVRQLLDFYGSPLGGTVRRILAHRIRARWRGCNGLSLMGLGFASPYLGSFRGEVVRLGALMPSTQGAVVWPSDGIVNTVVVDEDDLPLPDNSVDLMLVVHCLETAEHVRMLLREIWRVLSPEGRLLIVVPNRRGLWARFDLTPFGHGRPYSQHQLSMLLSEAMLTPIEWGAALHLPPFDNPLLLRSAATIERMGARVTPAFAGVLLVEARKELTSPIAKPALSRRLTELVPLRGTSRAEIKRQKGNLSPHRRITS